MSAKPKLRILGIDPGFAKTGWAVITLGDEGDILSAMGVVSTEKESRKRNTYETADSFERARLIAVAVTELLDTWDPKIVCFEAQSPVRNSGVAAKLGMTYGVLASLVSSRGLPVVMPTPQKVKKQTVGKLTASKEEVQEFVAAKFATTPVYAEFSARAKKGDIAHPNDAIAVVYASRDAEALRILRQLA